MKARKEYLRLRREYLISQAAAQRSEVRYIASSLRQRLRLVDAVFAIGQAVHVHPILAVAGGALLLRRAPRRKLLVWAGELLAAWKAFDAVHKQWSRR